MRRSFDLLTRNRSGMALVIALILMVVLTLLGLASSLSSTFEIKLSGNKRGSTGAFYSADTGVQVVMANIKQGKGTAGALLVDQQIYDDLKELVRDLKRNPWKFFWKE